MAETGSSVPLCVSLALLACSRHAPPSFQEKCSLAAFSSVHLPEDQCLAGREGGRKYGKEGKKLVEAFFISWHTGSR